MDSLPGGRLGLAVGTMDKASAPTIASTLVKRANMAISATSLCLPSRSPFPQAIITCSRLVGKMRRVREGWHVKDEARPLLLGTYGCATICKPTSLNDALLDVFRLASKHCMRRRSWEVPSLQIIWSNY